MSNEFLDWQKDDFYALLGITRMADIEEIRRAYRKRAMECHPDRLPLDSPERKAAELRFLELTVARDTLLDPLRREAYDRQQDLTQQAWLDSMVSQYQTQIPLNPPPRQKHGFQETLKRVFEEAQERDDYQRADFIVGDSGAKLYSQEDDEDEAPRHRGLPGYSRKNAAAYYYAQGVRLAARGQYRRALYALNNASMLDPDIEISPFLLNKIRTYAYYSSR
ncbi:MAG TPA: DnaJ domain-containing protein [Candidatus Obscuribacterales bacterium]